MIQSLKLIADKHSTEATAEDGASQQTFGKVSLRKEQNQKATNEKETSQDRSDQLGVVPDHLPAHLDAGGIITEDSHIVGGHITSAQLAEVKPVTET